MKLKGKSPSDLDNKEYKDNVEKIISKEIGDNTDIDFKSADLDEEKVVKKNKKSKENQDFKWFIEVFIMTFILSMLFSYISTNGVSNLGLIPAILILVAVIGVGIIFDIIGVAVTVANEEEFHAKATKKVKGSKSSIKLIKNAPKVANICADVIGDICGVLSGAISALIAVKITSQFGFNFDMQFLLSALVSALTVGGKALGKTIANNNSTPIVHAVGMLINKFSRKH